MKRSKPLARKTPLQAHRSLSRGKGLRGGPIKPRKAVLAAHSAEFIAPKRAKSKPKAKDWEKAHLRAVKNLPCVVCGIGGINHAHHCYHDRATKFGGRKAPHRWTIPLCKFHHQDGPNSIHRAKATWRRNHGPDWSHVPAVMLAIYGRENPTDSEIETHWKEKGLI